MEYIFAGLIGGLFSLGIYMILRGSIVSVVIGVVMLAHAANVFIFVISGLKKRHAPILTEETDIASIADPLPQALILTAIVISFAITAFMIVLVRTVYQSIGKENINQMRSTDSPEAL